MIYDDHDHGFERRWSDWKARGRAHERAVRKRFAVVTTVAGPFAAAAFVMYVLLGR
ncbi:MAG: hypothetical protein IT181_02315 [Acidobacteria bacterium]|nr:hypothetical protein [Acidobacteriota bacterium]